MNRRLLTPKRALDLVTFSVEADEESTLVLHVQCPWRIVMRTEILVAQSDFYRPSADDLPEFAYDNCEAGTRWQDVRLEALAVRWGAHGVRIRSVAVDACGGFELHLVGGFRLDVFPDSSVKPGKDYEFWRLFGGTNPHFVVGPNSARHDADV